jgi:hypothetical protein
MAEPTYRGSLAFLGTMMQSWGTDQRSDAGSVLAFGLRGYFVSELFESIG